MEVTVTLFWKPPQELLKKVKVDLLGIGDKFPTFFCKILLRSGLRESLSRKRMCVCACTEAYADFLLIYRRQNAHKLCFGSEFPAFKLIIYGNKRCYLVWASRSLTSTSTWGKPHSSDLRSNTASPGEPFLTPQIDCSPLPLFFLTSRFKLFLIGLSWSVIKY